MQVEVRVLLAEELPGMADTRLADDGIGRRLFRRDIR